MTTPPFPVPPRGARADAETDAAIYVIKNVLRLHATYQVRLLALKAAETGKKLVLKVPPVCQFEPDLARLVHETHDLIQREDLP